SLNVQPGAAELLRYQLSGRLIPGQCWPDHAKLTSSGQALLWGPLPLACTRIEPLQVAGTRTVMLLKPHKTGVTTAPPGNVTLSPAFPNPVPMMRIVAPVFDGVVDTETLVMTGAPPATAASSRSRNPHGTPARA